VPLLLVGVTLERFMSIQFTSSNFLLKLLMLLSKVVQVSLLGPVINLCQSFLLKVLNESNQIIDFARFQKGNNLLGSGL
jgi:hypothetical protein